MIITIDGPAGSGKSTVAEILAKELEFIHFNSGSLYRGVTAHFLSKNFDIESITSYSPIPDFKLKTEMINGIQHVIVNDYDYTPILRDNLISTLVPFVAANKFCREKIDECQKVFCSTHNVVMEGRDLGSFVFPNAEFKFYLDCSVKERARRRFNEEMAKKSKVTLKEIEKQLKERDKTDKSRKVAPLVVPKNAILVDSTNLNIDEVVALMLKNIKSQASKTTQSCSTN